MQPARSVQNTSKVGSKLEACPVCSRSSTSCSSSSSSSTAQQQTQPAHLQLSAAPSALLPPSQSRVRRKPNPYHASEPTAWSSPRHDWYRVSHNLHEQHAAGPAHAPAAPIIACAFAKNTPYHTSHRPPTRARLIRRRPPPGTFATSIGCLLVAPRQRQHRCAALSLRCCADQRGEETEESPTRALHKPL